MIISSKFKDYYDTISKHGVDKTVVYNREILIGPLTEKYGNRLLPFPERLGSTADHLDIEYGILGFCGKIYPYISITHNLSVKNECHSFYTFDTFIKHVNSLGFDLDMSKNKYFMYGNLEKSTKGFLKADYKNLIQIFQIKKSPVFNIWKKKSDLQIELNPKLNKVEFFKVKDAFTTFQDIYMYISGVLIDSEKPIVKISDKDMQISKGHYGKYSFKKPPGKGKWR